MLLVARVGGAIDGSIGVGGGEIVAHLCLLVMNGDGKEAAVMGCMLCCAVVVSIVAWGRGVTFSVVTMRSPCNAVGRCNGVLRIVL